MKLGYRPTKEDRTWLRAHQSPFPYAASETARAPAVIDHRGWLQVENQGGMSSCVGHGDSSALEVCNYCDTGGEVIHLSRWFAYITAQRESGLAGRDQGATISGAVRANAKYGICQERTCPYPSRYTTSLPREATEEAASHKLLRYTAMGGYEDCLAWLQTGQGGVIIGVRWVPSLSGTNGVIEKLSGNSRGFHCVVLLGYSDRRDSRDRQYLWMLNSHGKGWGNAGWAEVAPGVIGQWCLRRDNEEVIGVSDIEEYGAREVPAWI